MITGIIRRKTVLFTAFLVGAALLAGCGNSGEQPAESETAEQSQSVSASEQAQANETGADRKSVV